MKILYIILGCISLALGVIGIFLPLLPTTPFLLLTATLFVRSSPRLYAWLLDNPTLGGYIRNYRENRRLPLGAKVSSLLLLWGSILYCIVCVVSGVLWAQLILAGIALGVTYHILSLK